MKRGRGILLGILGVGLIALLLAAMWPTTEPSYQDKKLSEWLRAYWSTSRTSEQAADAVRHIGTNALPFLVEWISYKRPQWKNLLPISVQLGRDEVREFRANLAEAGFVILQAQAAPAVPALARLLNDWSARRRTTRVLRALASVGEQGLPALVTVVTNKAVPKWGRCYAAQEMLDPIMKFGTNIGWAVRLLVPCLQDSAVAAQVAEVLGAWKLAPEEVVPALVTCLRSPDPALRGGAADALRAFGTQASSGVPELLVLLSDTDPIVRLMGTNALEKIAPEVLTNAVH